MTTSCLINVSTWFTQVKMNHSLFTETRCNTHFSLAFLVMFKWIQRPVELHLRPNVATLRPSDFMRDDLILQHYSPYTRYPSTTGLEYIRSSAATSNHLWWRHLTRYEYIFIELCIHLNITSVSVTWKRIIFFQLFTHAVLFPSRFTSYILAQWRFLFNLMM